VFGLSETASHGHRGPLKAAGSASLNMSAARTADRRVAACATLTLAGQGGVHLLDPGGRHRGRTTSATAPNGVMLAMVTAPGTHSASRAARAGTCGPNNWSGAAGGRERS
jgi:hypothetical protein